MVILVCFLIDSKYLLIYFWSNEMFWECFVLLIKNFIFCLKYLCYVRINERNKRCVNYIISLIIKEGFDCRLVKGENVLLSLY